MQTHGARLNQLVERFAGKRILVIGDLMLDHSIWGKVSRISPEAPVPVVSVTGESYYPGGAANVARNVREFTAGTIVMGLAGADAAGEQLLELLQTAGIDTAGVQRDSAFPTTVKTRIIARNQQVVRVDRECKVQLSPARIAGAIEFIDGIVKSLDAIVVADYGKGFVSQPLADHLCRAAQDHHKILAVDPHPHTSLTWRGATVIKPNRAEAFLAAGMPPSDPVIPVLDDAALMTAGDRLRQVWSTESLLITLGEHGMLLFGDGRPAYHTPTRARAVYDVSGAGDTAIAVLALGLAAGAAPAEAAELANRASGIVVGKLGTAIATLAELQSDLGSA